MKKLKTLLVSVMIGFMFGLTGCKDNDNDKDNEPVIHSIDFIVDNEIESTVTVEEGNKISVPEDPSKTGYDFVGWYNGDAKFDFNSEIKGEIDLVARFEATEYELNLFLGGGTIEGNFPTSSRYTIEDTIMLPTPTKENYIFVGWKKNGTDSVYATVEFSNQTGNLNYEAIWRNDDIALLYIDNILYKSMPVTLGVNALVSVDNLDDTTAGWFKDPQLIQVVSNTDVITQGMKLYTKQYNTLHQNMFTINNEELTVYYGGYNSWNGVIPRKIDGQLVKKIVSISGGYATKRDIVIPSSVVSVQAYAFENERIANLPNSIKKMGEVDVKVKDSSTIIVANTATTLNKGAFVGIPNIEFEENSKIETLEQEIFSGTNITTIKIPNSVKTIETKAFYGLETLTSVTFEENSQLETIGEEAFYGTKVTTITIPRSVRTIERAFYGLGTLTSIEFEGNSQLETIGEEAFHGTKLTTITIPSSVKAIRKSAFTYIETLIRVEFEEGSQLETIGERAFYDTKLTSIRIPRKVKIIKASAFSDIEELKVIEFEANSDLETIEDYGFYGSSVEELTFESNIYRIGYNAFANPGTLKSVVFNKSGTRLYSLNSNMFEGAKLTTIKIPSSVQIIGESAFEGMDTLTSVTFEENSMLQTIGEKAFYGTKLTTITIPKNVKTIGERAFYDLRTLTNVEFRENSQLETIERRAFYGCYPSIMMEIPISVTNIGGVSVRVEQGNEIIILKENTEIGEDAFGFLPIKKVTFEENSQLETIGNGAFAYTTLTTVKIPNSVKIIDDGAFNSIRTLTSVTFEEDSQLETIGSRAFLRTEITTISIPENVKKIDLSAFKAEIVVVVNHQAVYDLIVDLYGDGVVLETNEIHVLKALEGTNNHLETNYDKAESGDYWVYTKKAN